MQVRHAAAASGDHEPADPGRRRFIAQAGVAAGLVVAPAFMRTARGDAWRDGTPLFALGVASGDPDARSVVLWTRLVDDPLTSTGLPAQPIPVAWEVALDPGMRRIVERGVALALPEHGHTVRVIAGNLPDDQWLYYRFTAQGRFRGHHSRVGRTRTFPGAECTRSKSRFDRGEPCRTGEMRFAVASCQSLPEGFYAAWADIARQDLDFVVHTGDYIYESGASSTPLLPGRNHVGGEIFSVEDYRNRYALYRLDTALQDAHASMPFILTWDDHEVDNNYAGLIAEEGAPFQDQDFAERRCNAYRVYRESMPLRTVSTGKQGGLRLFRRLRFGNLADIHMLDTRQYRTDQPAGDGFGSTDTNIDPQNATLLEQILGERIFDASGILAPGATLLGLEQEAWLALNLARSRARWNVLAQQVMVMPWNLRETGRLSVQLGRDFPGKEQALALIDTLRDLLNVDAWDGYQAARERLLRLLDRTRPASPVILTGDIHSAWAADLFADFGDPQNSDVVAVEFVCTSVSSTFLAVDPRPTDAIVRAGLPDNPHIRYFNGRFRGYCLCEVDERRWLTAFRAVGAPEDLTDPDPLALVPMESDAVFTDAEVVISNGFNQRGRRNVLEVRGALT